MKNRHAGWVSTFEELQFYGQRAIGKRAHAKLLAQALIENNASKWNRWRRRNPDTQVDLRGAVLDGRFLWGLDLSNARLDDAELVRADLASANLAGASLRRAKLMRCNFAGAHCEAADFSGADLGSADLSKADLRRATFREADLSWAMLIEADLSGATFRRANLYGARLDNATLRSTKLVECRLDHASFVDSRFEGDAEIIDCSAPYVNAKRIRIGPGVEQRSLFLGHTIRRVFGGLYSRKIVVDDLRAASFVGELETPAALAHLIAAGADYLVLVLGRFDGEGRATLEAIERNLWARGRIPVVFDFPGPERRNLVDVVRFLACLAELVIVDLTRPKSVPFELDAVVPHFATPVISVIKEGHEPFSMFDDLRRRYPWVLPPFSFRTTRQIDRHFDAMLELAEKVGESTSERARAVGPVMPLAAAARLLREAKAPKRKQRKKRRA